MNEKNNNNNNTNNALDQDTHYEEKDNNNNESNLLKRQIWIIVWLTEFLIILNWMFFVVFGYFAIKFIQIFKCFLIYLCINI